MKKSNKTVLGFSLIMLLAVNFLVFKIALRKELNLVEIPISIETIYPREKIKDEHLKMIEVPKAFVNESMLVSKEDIVNKYSDIQTTIPKNSPFFEESLFEESELPDYPTILLKDQQVVYNLISDLKKMSGNSIVVGQKIDIYTTLLIKNEKPIVDLLVSAVRVIGVKDKKGFDISHPESNKIPHIVLLALDENILPIVRSCDEISKLELYAYSKNLSDEESVLNNDALILEYINYVE